MKILLATSALAVVMLAGPPASAQLFYGQDSAGAAFAQAAPQRARPVVQRRNQALARQLYQSDGRVHSPNPAFDVYDTNGNYIGSDPDVAIRNELMRDPPERGD